MNLLDSNMKEMIIQDIEWIAKELTEFDRLRGNQGKIVSGSWYNSENFMAYVSYFPQADPSGESLDATIHLMFQQEKVSLSADICRSDGVILAEIAQHSIDTNSEEDLNSYITSFSQRASIEMLIKLKQLLETGFYNSL